MKILVVAGEASADMHAAHALAALKKKLEEKGEGLELLGIGGDRLVKLGLKPVRAAREMAVVGLTEVIRRIPSTLRLMRELAELAEREKPDFALLLDLPDFNLRLAKLLKERKIRIVYYISPQVWAWRSGRVKRMAELLDLLLVILPFEKKWYEEHAAGTFPVSYVGHPVLEEVPEIPYAPEENRIALLPGSRESEWKNLFPVLIESARLMKRRKQELLFSLPLAETLRGSPLVQADLSLRGPYASALKELGDSFRMEERPAYEVHAKSKLALVASGTATLEAAVVGVPMLVLYRVSKSSAFLFRHVVGYKGAIAMANLVHTGLASEERVVPELLQEECNPQRVAAAALEILENPELWERQRARLAQTRSILSGTGSPSGNVAEELLRFREGGDERTGL